MGLPRFLGRHREFIGHFATMMSGKALAAAIALLTMPIVARLFTPTDFGVAALFASLVSLVSHAGALRYEAALILPREHDEALTLMAFAYRLAAGTCVIMLALTGLYHITWGGWSVLELLGGWKWLLPFGVLLMTVLHIQDSWLTRTKAFPLASASLVVGNITTSGTRIAFGTAMGSTVFGLIVGQILGMACRLGVQKVVSREGIRAAFSKIGWSTMRDIARRYSDFPKLNAPAGLIFSTGQNLPVLLFGVMFSPAVAGFYAMANRLSQVPITVVAASLRRVFLQKVAEIYNRGGSLQKPFLLTTGGLGILGALPFTGLWLFGEPLATWILGDRWTMAGRYLEIIAPWLFMVWVTAPCNSVFIVLRQQKLWLTLQTALTVLRLAAFGVAHTLAAGPEWTLQAFVMVTVVGNLATIVTTMLLISQHAVTVRTGRKELDSGREPLRGDEPPTV